MDLQVEEEGFTVVTEPADFHAVQDALREKGITWEEAALEMVPKTEVRVEGPDAETLVRLLELLEDMDDVQKVYSNADLDIDSLAEV